MRMLLQRVNLPWLWSWVAVYGGSLTVLTAYGLSLVARRALGSASVVGQLPAAKRQEP